MGSSAQQVRQGIFMPYSDEKVGTLPSTFAVHQDLSFPTTLGKMLLWNIRDSFPDGQTWTPTSSDLHIHWHVDKHSQVLLLEDQPGPVRFLEMFSGGHGGWGFACRFIRQFTQVPSQIIALEYDQATIAHYAIHHGAVLVSGDSPLPKGLIESGLNVAIHADVTARAWVPQVAAWRPDIAVISAPCGPWSKAGQESGFFSPCGLLFSEAIAQLRWIRPKVILIENVPGFMTHAHSQLILKQLQAAGYRIRWSRAIDASAWTCVSRNRWLCMATLLHDPIVQFERFDMWPASTQHTPQEMDTILHLPDHVLSKLHVTEDIRKVSSKAEYLPLGQRNMIMPDANAVWKSRCYTSEQTLPTFMASYGSQHAIAHEHLRKKGCYAHYFQPDDSPARFWHPAEIALHHLVWEAISTSADLRLSWQIEGNQIAVPHAALMICNALNALPTRHPPIAIHQLFHALWDHRLKASELVFKHHELFDICHHIHCNRFDETALGHVQDLLINIKQGTCHAQVMWTLTQGLFTQDEWLTMSGNRVLSPLPSLISVPSTEEDNESLTAPFATMLAGRVNHEDHESTFWFQHDIALNDFTHVWSQDPDIATCHARWLTNAETADTGKSVEINPCREDMHDIADSLSRVVAYCQDGQLSLYRATSGASFQDCLNEWALPAPLHDQFGALPLTQQPFSDTLLLPPCADTYSPFQMPAIVMSAFQTLTEFSTKWDLTTGIFTILGQGCNSSATTMSEFWASLIPCDRLMHIGLKVQADKTEGYFQIKFIPTGRTCPMPPGQFWLLLAAAAARAMLAGFRDDGGIPFQLKWLSRPLWKGCIAATTTMEQLETVLNWTLHCCLDSARPRLICNGRQNFHTTIAELAQQSPGDVVKCHIVTSLHGGGAKELNRVQVKNSIAATLLESGYALSQVQEIVEAVLTKAGLKKAMSVARLPGGQDRNKQTLQLCKDCHVSMPEPMSKQPHQSAHAQATGQKVKRPTLIPPVPADYTVVPGFLCNQDAAETKQIPQITSASTGVCLVDAETAKPWLRENQLISKDELALFIIDTQKPDTDLEVQQILMPCTNRQDQQVIMSGFLVQLGEKQVVVKEIASQQVDLKQCQVAALTVWRDEWTDQEWKGFLKSTNSTFRQSLGDDGDEEAIPSIWGRSLRAKGKPASDQNAESIQVHCTVSQDASDRLLSRSGFCKVYVTPKAENGRSSEDYKIIWLKGDLAHITAQAAKTTSCAGLIRGIMVFNGTPVIAQFVPPRAPISGSSHAIVAGPKPTHQGKMMQPNQSIPGTADDPWAHWSRSHPAKDAPMPQARSVQGPIEQQFQKQDQRISELEKTIKSISQSQEALKDTTEKTFHEVAQRDAQTREYVAQSMDQIRKDLQTSLTQAMDKQSASLNSNMEELKQLFRSQAKRPRKADEDMEESD
eukprot:s2908_g8.t1